MNDLYALGVLRVHYRGRVLLSTFYRFKPYLERGPTLRWITSGLRAKQRSRVLDQTLSPGNV